MNLLGEFSNVTRKADDEEEDFAFSPTFPDVQAAVGNDKDTLKKNVSETVQQVTDPSLDQKELPKVSKKTEQREDIDIEALSNSSKNNLKKSIIKKRALQTTNSSLHNKEPKNVTQNVGHEAEIDSGHSLTSSEVPMRNSEDSLTLSQTVGQEEDKDSGIPSNSSDVHMVGETDSPNVSLMVQQEDSQLPSHSSETQMIDDKESLSVSETVEQQKPEDSQVPLHSSEPHSVDDKEPPNLSETVEQEKIQD